MGTTSYITPITNRTYADVEYARSHQNDLEHKNIGAWNYTDINRICNNLKYAAEHMYEVGFLLEPYSMQLKTDWKETDIITFEQLNDMIINNMNNLKTYSRADLYWYNITSIANMDYSLANWIERNIDAMAKQEPLPPDTYQLLVEEGTGSGYYEAGTVIQIQANAPADGEVFDHWSGDRLEFIDDPMAMITTYTMPRENIILRANYTGITPHNLTVKTHTKTNYYNISMGKIQAIEADPAPQGKVFHHWIVEPERFEDNLYEPAATTTFTMPNEEVTLTAFYVTKGKKQLNVVNGKGSGWYEYDTYVAVSSNKPADGTFTSWSGDTQYLTGPITQEYNSVRIPDVSSIRLEAHWTVPPVPPEPYIPATNVPLKLTKAKIVETGEREGVYNEGDQVQIIADDIPDGWIFTGWSCSDRYAISSTGALTATVSIGRDPLTVIANYRELKYATLRVITHSSSTEELLEMYDYFTVNASPAPDGYTFDHWDGDINTFASIPGFNANQEKTGTCMGETDRRIEAIYRPILEHTLTIHMPSGEDEIYRQNEFSSISISAPNPPEGQTFTGWEKKGKGTVHDSSALNTTFTFGNGDTELTPTYRNIWTVPVTNGALERTLSGDIVIEGYTYKLQCRALKVYEKFEGWTLTGPGQIENLATPTTYFTVGEGNAVIIANISTYPDKTLSIYKQDPDTGETSLVSSKTYTFGSHIEVEAPIAPNRTTFLSWLGDVETISPSALASSVELTMNKDIAITATYFYPESPEYYILTVKDGYPAEGSYPAGSQVTIRANDPNPGWEFYKWYGDIQYLVNPDLTNPENAVIMPLKAISLYAKFKIIGQTPLYRVSVIEGFASGTYTDDDGVEHEEEGVYIDVPADTKVTLTANPDTVGWVFDRWVGNFESAGITDITVNENPATFTMTEHDINIEMKRRELGKYTAYPTNAIGPTNVYPGTYPIEGNLYDTDDKHYTFEYWSCVDSEGNDCIEAIVDPTSVVTDIVLTDKNLWITANYKTHYKLTVIDGQDDGDGFYYEGEIVNSVYANDPPEGVKLYFDYWNDPVGIIKNIYSPRPKIIMKDSVATITAVFSTMDAKGNSVAVTGDDLHSGLITRTNTSLINGVFTIGTMVFDKDGCIGVITEVNPDSDDDTDDYKVEKLFYGGNA